MITVQNRFILRSLQAVCIILSITSQLSLVYGQKKVVKQDKKMVEAQNWLNRSNQLTSKLKEDLFHLPNAKKSLFLTQIAKLWWKEDNAAAKKTLKGAISLVSVTDNDTETVRNEKLAAARILLNTIILFDKQSADILIEQLSKAEREKTSGQTPELNAKAILQSALAVIDNNSQQSLQLGLMSLRYGIFPETLGLIAQLSLRNEDLASKLAISTVNLAVSKSESRWVNSLSSLVFIAFKGRHLTDEAKKVILEAAFNDAFNRQNAQNSCDSILREINLITFYDQYLPEKSVFIRQKGIQCRQGTGAISDAIGEKLGETGTKSVDDLISAAENSKNAAEKAEYYLKALKMLAESKQFLKALTVLDNIREEDRKDLGDFGDMLAWEQLRLDYAYEACLIILKQDDFNSLRAVIENTPDYLRPILQGRLAADLVKSKSNLYALELLPAVRKRISQVKNKNVAAETYLKLFRTYLNVEPNEVPGVFAELIKVINEADTYASENNLPGFRSDELIVSLPAELLEIDEGGTFNALESLESLETKAKLRLGLLESSLSRYIALKNNK
jgi:hypothetical protein